MPLHAATTTPIKGLSRYTTNADEIDLASLTRLPSIFEDMEARTFPHHATLELEVGDVASMSDYLCQLRPNGVPQHITRLKVDVKLSSSYVTFAVIPFFPAQCNAPSA